MFVMDGPSLQSDDFWSSMVWPSSRDGGPCVRLDEMLALWGQTWSSVRCGMPTQTNRSRVARWLVGRQILHQVIRLVLKEQLPDLQTSPWHTVSRKLRRRGLRSLLTFLCGVDMQKPEPVDFNVPLAYPCTHFKAASDLIRDEGMEPEDALLSGNDLLGWLDSQILKLNDIMLCKDG